MLALLGSSIVVAQDGGAGAPPAAAPMAARPTYDAVPKVPLQRIDHGPTPMTSLPDWQLHTFRIPAPRSVVVSSDGVVLATNHIGKRRV